ncbi:MAG: hypothetical protein VBE63_18335 [Lamprobacter sp.]|uniref:hypothetical protein n=1 Tax=Lamprobacter sp. TaxID=3100796 RepID=UPI002B25AB9E|nr:hypothetical protein [Lamprobacter sp.]MEA3641874.1 hypothetical protein [Lamprobacter sp.]
MNATITKNDLRKMLSDTAFAQDIEALTPNDDSKPTTPDGFPADFKEALFFSGPCAIPLNGDEGWKWYAVLDGSPLLCKGTWGPESRFDSFESALDFAREFAEHKRISA